MQKQIIEISCGDWDHLERRKVMATVIGRIAVYSRGSATRSWVVSHIKTGTRIAAFTAEHVAREFARRIDAMVDWDSISSIAKGRKLTPQQVDALNQVEALRWHETFVPTKSDIERYGDKRHSGTAPVSAPPG